MVKLDMTRDELRTIVRDEVRCTVDCVYMNYSKVPGVVFINAWTDNPHAGFFIRTVTDLVKPVDESTWIYVSSVSKRKEAYDSCDFKPLHPFKV